MAFDPRVFERAEPIRLAAADEFAILYAGSVSRIEGINFLIDAFRRVRGNAHARPRLFVVGNTAHSETIGEYKAAAGELVSDGSVSFLPAVGQERYASLLERSRSPGDPPPDISGFPGRVSLQARRGYIASGAPVLATRFGDVEEYFSNNVHCLMCDPDDSQPLAAGIEFAMAHADRLRALGEQGLQRVKELFAIDAVAGQLRQLLESGVRRDRRRSA